MFGSHADPAGRQRLSGDRGWPSLWPFPPRAHDTSRPSPPHPRVSIAQGAACPSPRPPRSPPSARAHPQWPGTPEDGRPCYNQPVKATVAVKASGVGAVKMGPTLLLQVTPERMACPTRRPLKGKSALPTALAPLQLRARSPGEGSWPVPPPGPGVRSPMSPRHAGKCRGSRTMAVDTVISSMCRSGHDRFCL